MSDLKECACVANNCANNILSSCTVSGLGAKRTVTLHVRAYDLARNITTYLAANDVNFRSTITTSDETAPVFTANLTLNEPNVSLNWSTASDNQIEGLISYKVFRKQSSDFADSNNPSDDGSEINTSPTTSYYDQELALIEGASYYYSVCAYDSSNNKTCASSSEVYIVADTTAPTFSSADISNDLVGGSTFNLNWTMSDNISSSNNLSIRIYRKITSNAATSSQDYPSESDQNVASLLGKNTWMEDVKNINTDGDFYINYLLTVTDESGNQSSGTHSVYFEKKELHLNFDQDLAIATDDGFLASNTGDTHSGSNQQPSHVAANGGMSAHYDFDGGDFIEVDGSKDDSLSPTTSVTISLWARKDGDHSGEGGLFAQGLDQDNHSYMIYEGSDGKITMSVAGEGLSYSSSDSAAITNARWNHYVGVWDGAFVKVYRNGIFQSEKATFINSLNVLQQNVVIGRKFSNTNADYWNGAIDDVRLYKNNALSATKVTDLFNKTKGSHGYSEYADPNYDKTVAVYNFSNGSKQNSSYGNNTPAYGGQGADFINTSTNGTIRLNGSQYLNSVPASVLDGASAYSLCAWFKVNQWVNNAAIFTSRGGGNSYTSISLANSNDDRIGIYGRTDSLLTNNDNFVYNSTPAGSMNSDAWQNNWTHVCSTWDNSDGHLTTYMDGYELTSKNYRSVGYNLVVTDNFKIGFDKAYDCGLSTREDRCFNGEIDGLRMYRDHALSPSEAQALYAADRKSFYGILADPVKEENFKLIAAFNFDKDADTQPNSGFTAYAGRAKKFGSASHKSQNGNGYFNFDGSSYFEMSNSAALEGANAVTMCSWMRPSDFIDNAGIVMLSGPGTSLGLSMNAAIDKKATFHITTNNATLDIIKVSTPNNTFVQGKWSHVCGTWENSTGLAKIFVDGNEVASYTSGANETIYQVEALKIGNNDSRTNQKFAGDLDEVRIYRDQSLNNNEIQALYDATKGTHTN